MQRDAECSCSMACSQSKGLLLFLISSLAQLDLCQSRPVPQYKNFQIEVGSQGYRLFGTETFRTSLKELLEHLQGQSLRTENLRFQLRRCCPPQPRGTVRPPPITLARHFTARSTLEQWQLLSVIIYIQAGSALLMKRRLHWVQVFTKGINRFDSIATIWVSRPVANMMPPQIL